MCWHPGPPAKTELLLSPNTYIQWRKPIWFYREIITKWETEKINNLYRTKKRKVLIIKEKIDKLIVVNNSKTSYQINWTINWSLFQGTNVASYIANLFYVFTSVYRQCDRLGNTYIKPNNDYHLILGRMMNQRLWICFLSCSLSHAHSVSLFPKNNLIQFNRMAKLLC